MKKFLLSFIMIICACTFILTGCNSSALKDNPATDAQVIGNGGFAIRKGDYLYYINGFVDDYTTELDDYKTDNVKGKVVYGAIYRTKLVNNDFDKDDKGFLNKSECVVSKVVGYDQGGFYIVGDYIYYATPYMHEDKNGTIQNTRISFNRIKIDGTKNKEFYITEEDASDIDWRINVINGKAHLVLKQTVSNEDGDSDTVVKTIADNGKKFKEVATISGISEVVLDDEVNLNSEYIFYTRSVKDGDDKKFTTSGTLVCKASLLDGSETVYELDKTSTFGLIALDNDKLYMTKPVGSKTYLYCYSVNESLVNQDPIQLSNDTYSSYYTIENVPYSVIAVDSNNNVVKLSSVNGAVVKNKIADALSTVIGVDDNYVYSYDSNVLYRTSIEDGTKVTVSGVGDASDKTFLIDSASMVDLDGRYVYVYAKYTAKDGETTGYYLNRIDTYQEEMVAEFVGVLADEHMVADPSEADDETDDDEEQVVTDDATPWIY